MKRSDLAKLAERVGVLVIDRGDAISADAPPGYVLERIGAHSTTTHLLGWTRPEAYDEIASAIVDGCRPCDDEECETCAEGMTFDALLDLYRGERIGRRE